MVEINHEIKIKASPARVFEALATVDGLRAWHSAQVSGGTGINDVLVFYHTGRPTFRWQVEQLQPPRHLVWRCVEGPGDAKGTQVIFDVSSTNDGRSLVELAHTGWPGTDGNFRKCNTYWGMLLHQLQLHVETGTTLPVFA